MNSMTLGQLNIGDTFEFEIGGPRWTAHPELPAAVDIPVSCGDKYKRVLHKAPVYYVIPALTLR